jgi:hypothetical protein
VNCDIGLTARYDALHLNGEDTLPTHLGERGVTVLVTLGVYFNEFTHYTDCGEAILNRTCLNECEGGTPGGETEGHDFSNVR